MHSDIPASGRPLECGNRGLAFKKVFGQEIGNAFGRLLVANCEAGAVRGGGEGRGHRKVEMPERWTCAAGHHPTRQKSRKTKYHARVWQRFSNFSIKASVDLSTGRSEGGEPEHREVSSGRPALVVGTRPPRGG